LYNAKEASLVQELAVPQKKASAVPAWAFPLVGMAAMFSFASFLAVRVRRQQRSTRRVQIRAAAESDVEALLAEEDVVLE